MLDPKFIRENSEQVKQNVVERGFDPALADVDGWLAVDERRQSALQELESINRQQNELAQQGKQGGNIDEIRTKGKELKEKQRAAQAQFEQLDQQWNDLISQIPNMHLDIVPKGEGESGNKVLREVGDKPEFSFQPKDHLQLAEDLDLLDFEAGAKVSGSQFYYVKNDAALLEHALTLWAFKFLIEKGFQPVITPDLAKSRYYLGTGYAPRGDEAQTYEITDEDLGLIATAEVTMAGYHADEVIPLEELPKKYVAISHCFRKEAGAYGKYSKGLYRVHQFTKVEMFIYSHPDNSDEMHQEILKMEEEIAQALGLPYRVVEMCTGDLGAMAARKFDLDAWMPGRGDYGEITSTSNCTAYQARNLNIKFKDSDGKNKFAHMLNGTAVTSTRHPLAIWENYQQEDGRIRVPEVLVPLMGKEVIQKR